MKKIMSLLAMLVMVFSITACNKTDKTNKTTIIDEPTKVNWLEDQTGVYYQVFVRSFADSNGDGIGDFNGLTNKLNYLKELGIEGIWLMPIHPSDSYHGYDVKDYYEVNPQYGTLADFEKFIEEAHKREIKVIIDLVINHTSKNHPWFVSASKDKNSEYRDYYFWASPTDGRVTREGQNLWHPYGDMYYASVFPGNYADLNFLNDKVRQEVVKVGNYWLQKGVNGFRLDAAKHLYEFNKVPKQYNYEDNIRFWNFFRTELQKTDPNVYLVGEVLDTVTVYSQYYKGLDSNFNFDLSNIIMNTVAKGNGSYTNQINMIYQQIGYVEEDFRDSPFLRNHDLDRTASILNGDIKKLKLSAEMLLTLPGNPYIYYGEEIGMFGVKTDGNLTGTGIWDETRRLPFVWGDSSITTSWMKSKCTPSLCSQPIDPLSKQINDENSLFSVFKDMITIRKENSALDHGAFAKYTSTNNYVQGFFRYDDKQLAIVIHNFSNIERDLPQFNGAKLIYQSKGTNSFGTTKIAATSTIILELPYNELNNYIQ